MSRRLRQLASLRLTLVGMALFAALALLGVKSDAVDVGWTALPMALLSVNLVAAIFTNRSIRTQSGLLVFHVGLLCVFVLIGITVVTRFDGHVEVLQGEAFSADNVVVGEIGWLHRGNLQDVGFVQGDVVVEYLPGLVRQRTRSTISHVDVDGRSVSETIGDRHAIEFEGYRFLATFNKGLALVLTWEDEQGRVETGAVHLPSYPQFDWEQMADWVTPAGQALRFELELGEPLVRVDADWRLQRPDVPYTVRIFGGDNAVGHIAPGEHVVVDGGSIHLRDLRLWMAYRVDYYRYLPWMFVAALLAIAGLGMHFGTRYLPLINADSKPPEREGSVAHVTGI